MMSNNIIIDLFHVTQKYNVIIRFSHFGRQAKFIYNYHSNHVYCGWLLYMSL